MSATTSTAMSTRIAWRTLQLVLGAVLFLYSIHLVIEQMRGVHQGHLFFLLLTLGVVEAAAAVVFLFAAFVGGPILLATFATATVLHLMHGEVAPVGSLLIYSAAVIAVMASRKKREGAAQ